MEYDNAYNRITMALRAARRDGKKPAMLRLTKDMDDAFTDMGEESGWSDPSVRDGSYTDTIMGLPVDFVSDNPHVLCDCGAMYSIVPLVADLSQSERFGLLSNL